MPGPLPKAVEARRRKNLGITGTKLPAPASRPVDAPPGFPLGKSASAVARRAWGLVWDSPIAARYLHLDVIALERYVGLIDQAATGPVNGAVLGQIARLEDRLGLTPGGRAKLHWEVEDAGFAPGPATSRQPSAQQQAWARPSAPSDPVERVAWAEAEVQREDDAADEAARQAELSDQPTKPRRAKKVRAMVYEEADDE